MIYISATYDKMSGPDATCSYKLVLSIDETQRNSLKELMDFKKGTPILLSITDVTNDTGMTVVANETEAETKKRLFNKMHAIINDVATSKNIDASVVKEKLKEFLITKGFMKDSSKELNIQGLSAAIYYLKNGYEL